MRSKFINDHPYGNGLYSPVIVTLRVRLPIECKLEWLWNVLSVPVVIIVLAENSIFRCWRMDKKVFVSTLN